MQNSIYLGKQIGNYRVSNVLASGSFGTVFLASHLYLKQRVVVIKFLHAVRLGSEEEKEQFLQEAQFLEMLRGLPHILPLLDVGVEGDSDIPYLITEYAERGSLRRRMKEYPEGHFSLDEARRILSEVGEGLQAAHDRQIVHRDLKPENILFSAKGEALLADFGISTVLTSTSIKHTDIVGTPAYMAPEQFRGEVSKESDQYALACIAYELLTGLKPFNAPDLVSMGFMHTSENPIPPREHNFYIPTSVENAILKALSKKRSDRFPSVASFIEALLQESQTRRSNTRPLGPGEEGTEDDAVTLPESSIPPTIAASAVPDALFPPTVYAAAPANIPVSSPDIPVESRLPSPPPLYLPGPPEELSTPLAPIQNNQVPVSGAYSGTPPPPPPPHVYGAQNVSTPRPQQPVGNRQGYTPSPRANDGSRQAQMYAPPVRSDGAPYLQGGYQVPASVRPEVIPFKLRLIAAACYLLPLISWIPFFRAGTHSRFARYHFAQSVLGWLAWIIYANLINNARGNGQRGLVDLLTICSLGFLVILIMAIIRSLQGRYYHVWLIGRLSDMIAGRR